MLHVCGGTFYYCHACKESRVCRDHHATPCPRCRITAPATAASGAIILNNQSPSIFTMPKAPNKSCDRAECVPESESGIQLAYKYISNSRVSLTFL